MEETVDVSPGFDSVWCLGDSCEDADVPLISGIGPDLDYPKRT